MAGDRWSGSRVRLSLLGGRRLGERRERGGVRSGALGNRWLEISEEGSAGGLRPQAPRSVEVRWPGARAPRCRAHGARPASGCVRFSNGFVA
jgi:hypothetical protein